ncbi:unnamed protein product [Vicia faba]|uniref:Uncharacterized protein n=1 Tax=Vicia faba TaxID=3906 RepID=A0AAV1AMT8_VICFA|nr:unnamed protein product [Vicia faba]
MEKYHCVTVINLLNNNLTGRIPPSLANCSILDVLDLGNNSLFGTIPDSLGQFQLLRSLHLNDNHFSGDLPSSLRNLSVLKTKDLGNNELSGSSQVLDLSRNDLTGSIPARLGDLKAIVQAKKKNKYLLYGDYEGHYYEESLNVYIKDQRLKYTKTLSLVTGIDLSDNNLTGNIPNEITKLSGLMVINLSRNHITYQIPETISNLRQLSYLDLSSNQFSGTIPLSLPSLTFLGSLNLSDNNLMGAIPYTGSVGLGFATGILAPYFTLAMKRSWSDAYFYFLDQVINKFLLRLPQPQGINNGQKRKSHHRQ